MTLLELVEAAHHQCLALVDWDWPCFGPGQKCLILGRGEEHLGTAVLDPESMTVHAVDLALGLWWVSEGHRASYVSWLASQCIQPEGREVSQGQILLALSEV